MARPNELDLLRRLLETLPTIGPGFTAMDQIAQAMDTSVDQARGIIDDLTSCETDGAPLGFVMLSPRDATLLVQKLQRNGKLLFSAPFAGQPDALEQLRRMREVGGIFVQGRLDVLSSQPRLTLDESQALLSALEFGGVSAQSDIARKLRFNVMPLDLDDASQLATHVTHVHDYEVLRALSLLCAQGRMAKIRYLSASDVDVEDPGQLAQRTIAPLELYTADNGHAYLDAWSYDHQEPRTYRIDRIVAVEKLAAHASPEVRAERQRRGFFADDVQVATLLAQPGQCIDTREWMDARTQPCDEDGAMRIDMPLQPQHGWVARHIAARFGEMQVMSPDELADDTRRYAQQALQQLDELRREFDGASSDA